MANRLEKKLSTGAAYSTRASNAEIDATGAADDENSTFSYMGIHVPSNGKFWTEPSRLDNLKPLSSKTFAENILFQQIYRKHFHDREHYNYLATSTSHGYVILSVRYTQPVGNVVVAQIIVRTSEKNVFISEEFNQIDDADVLSNPVSLVKKVLPAFDGDGFCPLSFPGVSHLILTFDEFALQTNFKIGVIYQKAGQYTEDELFGNIEHSKEFEDFICLLGDKVKLKGFMGYRGGLDVSKSDSMNFDTENNNNNNNNCLERKDEQFNGESEESIYTQFTWSNLNEDELLEEGIDIEVMYHVSTLMPHSPNDRQQLARKRHIGNDIVSIVYQEPGAMFNPLAIASNFLHVYLVVQPVINAEGKGTSGYRVIVVSKDDVPSCKPFIKYHDDDDEPILFAHDRKFRDFIIAKAINAEVAATENAAVFSKLHTRTRKFLFETLSRELWMRMFDLFGSNGGLRAPNNLVPLRNDEAGPENPNKDSVMIGNKRSGSILKSIKKTFTRNTRPNSSTLAVGNAEENESQNESNTNGLDRTIVRTSSTDEARSGKSATPGLVIAASRFALASSLSAASANIKGLPPMGSTPGNMSKN